MRVALCALEGSGASHDKFRPRIALPEGWGMVDLRPDCTVVDGVAIVASAQAQAPLRGALVDLGDDLGDTLPVATRRRVESVLGLSLNLTSSPRAAIRDVLVWQGGRPRRWRRLTRHKRGPYRVVLDGVLVDEFADVTATVFSETFNKADSSTLGPNLTWTEVLGDAEVFSNKWRNVTGASDVVTRAEHDVGSDAMYAQATANFASTANWAVGARFDPSAITFYSIESTNQNQVAIVKGVANSFTTVGAGQATTFSPATDYLCRVECNGSTIRILANAVDYSQTDVTITGFQRGGVKCFGTAASGITFDNFSMGKLVEDTPVFMRRTIFTS